MQRGGREKGAGPDFLAAASCWNWTVKGRPTVSKLTLACGDLGKWFWAHIWKKVEKKTTRELHPLLSKRQLLVHSNGGNIRVAPGGAPQM